MKTAIFTFVVASLVTLGTLQAQAFQGTCNVQGGFLSGPSLHAQIGGSPLTLSVKNAKTGITLCVVQQLQSFQQSLMGKLGYQPYLFWEGVGCGIRWSLIAGDFSCWAKVGNTEYAGEGNFTN